MKKNKRKTDDDDRKPPAKKVAPSSSVPNDEVEESQHDDDDQESSPPREVLVKKNAPTSSSTLVLSAATTRAAKASAIPATQTISSALPPPPRNVVLALAATAVLNFTAFLYFIFPLEALLALGAFVSSSSMIFVVIIHYVRSVMQRNLETRGIGDYLPDRLYQILTQRSIHELLTNNAAALENRHMLLYFLPLPPEQKDAFIDQLPPRRREVLLRPGLGNLLGPGFMRLILGDEGIRRRSEGASLDGVEILQNEQEEEEQDDDQLSTTPRPRLLALQEDEDSRLDQTALVGAESSSTVAGLNGPEPRTPLQTTSRSLPAATLSITPNRAASDRQRRSNDPASARSNNSTSSNNNRSTQTSSRSLATQQTKSISSSRGYSRRDFSTRDLPPRQSNETEEYDYEGSLIRSAIISIFTSHFTRSVSSNNSTAGASSSSRIMLRYGVPLSSGLGLWWLWSRNSSLAIPTINLSSTSNRTFGIATAFGGVTLGLAFWMRSYNRSQKASGNCNEEADNEEFQEKKD